MQGKINVPQEDNERKQSRLHSHCPTARHYKRFGLRIRILLPAFVICLMGLVPHGTSIAQMSHPAAAPTQSDAQKAFELMKSMAGSWDGTIMGLTTHVTIRVTSSGNAIVHEATAPGRADNPITVFYVDGDRLVLTHYCDSGNRPRMVGKVSPDGKTIEFEFLDVTGSTQHGMMNHMVFSMIDADHHSEGATWMFPGNKPMGGQAVFTRSK